MAGNWNQTEVSSYHKANKHSSCISLNEHNDLKTLNMLSSTLCSEMLVDSCNASELNSAEHERIDIAVP